MTVQVDPSTAPDAPPTPTSNERASANDEALVAQERRAAQARARDFGPVLFAAGLFAIAFALRFLTARMLAGEPVWDGHYYDFGARRTWRIEHGDEAVA